MRYPMLIGRRYIPTAKRARTTPKRIDAALKEEEAPSEWPKNPWYMIIYWHRDAIKSRRGCGWRREEVKKFFNSNGEKVGKQLCIGEKNQLLNEYYFLKKRMTLIEQQKKWRNEGGIFAKTKGVKNPCAIKYLVEEALGMGPKYVPCLIKQLRKLSLVMMWTKRLWILCFMLPPRMNLERRFMSASLILSRWRRNSLLRHEYTTYTLADQRLTRVVSLSQHTRREARAWRIARGYL